LDPSSTSPTAPEQRNTLVFSLDGEYKATADETAHWSVARMLLSWVLPDPARDPFVPLWYRAIAARFEGANLYGNARYHLAWALATVPRDPVLLFYAGAMYDAYASPSIQTIPLPRAAAGQQVVIASPREEWRLAERLLRDSVAAKGPLEAQVRLGRVLGRLGRHQEAVSVLRRVQPSLAERRLQYFAHLFLGSEEGALDHVAEARDSLNRAAALYPAAQSPLLALSELLHRTGDRQGALEALRRLEKLPPDPDFREDPWRDYLRSFALDADEQIAAMRRAVDSLEYR
jgi:tetratricopeptide (TPR) repeat protein